jgi:ATP-dependent Clp protease protease subunit
MQIPPIVIEKSARGDVAYDIYSRLLKDRIIFLGGPITSEVAGLIVAQILYLSIRDSSEPISLYVMSEGGDINAGLAIYDTIQYVPNKVATYCIGQACSMAAFLVASGTAGMRMALPSSRLMIHQPWANILGDATEVELQAQEIRRIRALIYERLARHTGREIAQIEKDCDRDNFMSAQEAKKYGLIDKVVGSKARNG